MQNGMKIGSATEGNAVAALYGRVVEAPVHTTNYQLINLLEKLKKIW